MVGHTGERNADTVATWALPEPSGLPAAPSFDATRPNTARVWSYQRGGNGCKNAFAADREAAEVLNAAMREIGAPDGKAAARENRAVLCRFVRYLSATGIRQFLDLGCGLPIHGSGEEVHEIVQRTAPGSRVVYVDIDPLVVVHGRALLADGTDVTAMQADLRQPQQILDQVRNKRLLDLDEPVAVLVVAVLHCLSDREDPGGVVAQLREAVAPGSCCVALTHLTTEAHPEGARLLQIKAEELGMSTPLVPRPPRA